MVLTPSSLDILRLGATSGKTVMLNFYSATPSTTKEYTPSGSCIYAHAYTFGQWEETRVSRERERERDG